MVKRRFLVRLLIFSPLIPGAFWVRANWGGEHRPIEARQSLAGRAEQVGVVVNLAAGALAGDPGSSAVRRSASDPLGEDRTGGGGQQIADPKSDWFPERNRVMQRPGPLRPAETYLACSVINPDQKTLSSERLVQLQRLIDSFDADIERANQEILKMQHDYIIDQVDVFDGGVPRGSDEDKELKALRDQLNEGFYAVCFKSSRSDAGERAVLILPGDCPGLDSAYNNAWAITMTARRAIVRHIEGS